MVLATAIFAVLLLNLRELQLSNGENIVRHACNTQAAFYKVASNYSMNDENKITNTTTEGLSGCVDLCVEYPKCKAFNYKEVNTGDSICELVQKDRTTNPHDIVSRTGWSYYDTGLFSTQIGQLCQSFTYNPCYPCLCIDSCYSNFGYSCNCTNGSPPLPEIYISFEKIADGDATKTAYDRGKDMNGNSKVTMKNGANIGPSTGRLGNVLRMTGTNAGATVGYFFNHPLNNPYYRKFSISFWLKVALPYSGNQTVFGTGSPSTSTGVLFRVMNKAKDITSCVIAGISMYMISEENISLTSWTHIAIAYNVPGKLKEVYINGGFLSRTTVELTIPRVTFTSESDLIFGAGYFYALENEYWNMHIDDFGIWTDHFFTSDDVLYIMSKGFVPDAV